MTFLHKLYGDWSKLEKTMLIPTCHEGSDDNEEVKMVLVHHENNQNSFNILNNSKSDNEAEENHFQGYWSDPQGHIQSRGGQSIEKFASFYNEDVNEIVEQATQEKMQKKI